MLSVRSVRYAFVPASAAWYAPSCAWSRRVLLSSPITRDVSATATMAINIVSATAITIANPSSS